MSSLLTNLDKVYRNTDVGNYYIMNMILNTKYITIPYIVSHYHK